MENIKINQNRDESMKTYGAIVFAVLIAVIGAFMMTLTSSPQMKGAAMLWIPAALQLIAGVWFGPKRGLLAGGLGAYAAGIIAYGGWGLVDIIMNPLAGGIANAWLPAILFSIFKINPDFGAEIKAMKTAVIRISIVLLFVIGIGVLPLFISSIGFWAYIIAIIVLFVGMPLILLNVKINKTHFLLAALICIFISAISAIIGSAGVVIGGNTWEGALIGTGLGWFLGDTVSCFLGLYMLAYFTKRARKMGLCSL
ncbi:MAG: hypothetical protein ACOYLE_08410 [Bacteroidales bacterium]